MGKLKLLMGGSPCTHWSIAQTKNRETEPSGLGWELFLNYRITRDKYQPDYFLYENNKSMSPAIRAQITRELGAEPVLINSALVSAQSRQRLYWFGKRSPDGTYSRVDVEQPEDRGILLRDILESRAVSDKEKAYTLRASAGVKQGNSNIIRHIQSSGRFGYQGCFEPVRIGAIESAAAPKVGLDISKQYKVYSPYAKATALCGNGGGAGAKTGLYAAPIRVGDMPTKSGKITGSQNARIYDADGKATTLTARPNGGGVDGPLYAVPAGMAWRGRGDGSAFEMRDDQKTNAVIVGHQSRLVIEAADGKTYPVYEVRDGLITIKEKQYPIKLADGYYIIRKLTVTECKRLQTVPESYVFPVSDTQAYKLLGNGWTVDVIAHILSHIPEIATGPVEVLSMYDGMSCGHIALDKLGANVVRYYATEIDKYAIQTTMANYPGTVQLGDAFQVRGAGWAV